MMSEMIERVAEAIQNRRREMLAAKGGPILIEPIELARAAIEAMREPTEAMKERGFQYTADPCWPDDVGRAWRHMIDEALRS